MRSHRVELLNVVQEFFATNAFLGTRDEMWGEFLPLFFQCVEEECNIFLQFSRLVLICLCKNDAEGDAVFAQPLNKLKINLLWC